MLTKETLFMKNRRIFSFDFIRVLAMLMIVVFHYNACWIEYQVQTNPLLFVQFANGTMGHIGVSLFFILSGASLMYSARKGLALKSYFKKRFLSIYPLYWITYAAFFTHFYIINRLPMTIPKSSLLLTLFGMDGYLYYKIPCYYLVGEWFVGCILILYLLFPILRTLMLRWPRATALVTAALYIPYLYFYPFQMENERMFLSRIPEFLFGMYFAAYFYGAGRSIPDAPAGESRPSKGSPLTGGPIGTKAGLLALAAFLFIFFVPVKLPQLCRIMWVGASGFTALAWISQFIDRDWLARPLKAASACSFAVFLVHHVLVPRYITPFSGAALSLGQNWAVFGRYFLCICAVGAVFYLLSKIAIKLITPLLNRI